MPQTIKKDNPRLLQFEDDEYDETDDFDPDNDIEEESEDDQPEDLDLEISPEEGYEDVDDPDYSDFHSEAEELNRNSSWKLMAVKTTTPTTSSKSKSHSETATGHTKNKKVPSKTETHVKTISKTPSSKLSESSKTKQPKDKPSSSQLPVKKPDKLYLGGQIATLLYKRLQTTSVISDGYSICFIQIYHMTFFNQLNGYLC
ncbi:unnamed protein product [Schistosoma curassoni]|nr:unnamed protein product [Schistosoma curassoni]